MGFSRCFSRCILVGANRSSCSSSSRASTCLFSAVIQQDVDGRDKPGHDDVGLGESIITWGVTSSVTSLDIRHCFSYARRISLTEGTFLETILKWSECG